MISQTQFKPKPYKYDTKRAIEIARILVERNLVNIGVELGVFQGEVFFYLLDQIPSLHLTGVDRWITIVEGDPDDAGWRTYETFPLERYKSDVFEKARVPKYNGRADIIVGDTAFCARSFVDKFFDFVFVDADHTEAGVRRDIVAWLPKIRKGGWILGHDYHFDGVRAVVDEMFPDCDHFADHIWGQEI